jgi:hypothetical protein|tara:strand:+ start:5877 stop:6083 length:207 start_codon:yes stop_codon:yes gene_type:complete
MTNTIKFINKSTIKLNKKTYKGYNVGELPKKFAFIYNEEKDQEGITEWFKHKGLTYVEYTPSIWSFTK